MIQRTRAPRIEKAHREYNNSEVYLIFRAVKYALRSLELHIDEYRGKQDDTFIWEYSKSIDNMLKTQDKMLSIHKNIDPVHSSRAKMVADYKQWLDGYAIDLALAYKIGLTKYGKQFEHDRCIIE